MNGLEARAAANHEWFVTWILPTRGSGIVNSELLAEARERERRLDADKARRDQMQEERDREDAKRLRKMLQRKTSV